MVTWFYFIVFLFALIMTGGILLRNKNVDTLLVLFSIVVTINCMGRYMLASAESIEMAIWANKFLYVGGCFAPLLTVFVLAKLCNQKLSPYCGNCHDTIFCHSHMPCNDHWKIRSLLQTCGAGIWKWLSIFGQNLRSFTYFISFDDATVCCHYDLLFVICNQP